MKKKSTKMKRRFAAPVPEWATSLLRDVEASNKQLQLKARLAAQQIEHDMRKAISTIIQRK
ncbi:hypothetical protein KB206_10765 [Microvirga sp. STS02]|uniref:hypothetical protein n=1 Tax=Hymenobacter negativus TaxID=2795026 RepID=UPI0018DCA224|nr:MULTISPECIES: hypothetical protein [Bacteria]MBH8569368.1 hypothetical protein [Hymenobacter negativus]MBR7209102.1 hypothetical protein [Microvirga sp. STS02]